MAKLLSGTRIYGNATVDTNLIVSGTTTSTTPLTGALTVAGGAGVVGNLFVGNILTASAGLQNTPIGNLTASSGQFTTVSATGNVNAAALASNGSITAITTLSALGGVQNTPIGNVTPSTALFTTVGASGNTTASALTVNNSATIGSTLGVAGTLTGTTINAATFGNSSAVFTGATYTATNSFNGPHNGTLGSAGGNTAIVSTLSATGNVTAAAVTSNGSITAITSLSALGGIQATPIGNVSPSTALFTSVGSSGNITTSALTVNNSATIGTTLSVGGMLRAFEIYVSQSAGDEGGQINFAPAQTNTSVAGNIIIDVFQNKIRFFESGGTNRGAYLDITGANAGVGTNLLSGGGSGTPGGTSGQVQYNLGSTFAGASGFTVSGSNVSMTALTVNSSAVIGSTLGVVGNIVADIIAATNNGNGTNFKVGDDTWIGDINIANTFRVTGQQDGTQGYIVFGNSNALSLGRSGTGALTYQGAFTSLGGVQATPIGNATASTGQFTTLSATGNVTGAGLTSNTSITAITTLNALGGLQATPIGNVTPSTALFTSVVSSGNITAAAVTSNGSITAVTSLSALGGLQATPIGNVTASTGQFTTISATGNVTGSALTSNGSITAITTLSSLGGIQNTPIGNLTPSTAIFTSESVSGNSTVNSLTVNNSATIGSTLGVVGNITAGNISTSGPSGNITGANIISANSFVAAVSFNGPHNGTLGSAGGNTAIVSTLSATGNATVNALTVNNSATIGTTLGVTGNIKTGGILTDGYYYANGSPFAGGGGSSFTSVAVPSQSSLLPSFNPVLTLANLPGLVFTTTQSNSTITMGMTGGTFATPSDFGLETGSVTYSQDLGSITGAVTESVNLSKLAVDGVVPGSSIVANSITGSTIQSNTNITTTGNVTTGAIYTDNFLFANGTPLASAIFPVDTIYELDDISNYTDGRSNSFKLTYNQANVTINSPFNLLVTVNGLTQPAFDFNLYNSYGALWGSYVLGSYKGYTIDSTSGNIKFANTPPINSQIMMRTVVGAPAATTKQYPFKAVDILLGF